MSLEVLIVGDSEKHQKLFNALELGLHEVSTASMAGGLVFEKAHQYSAIIFCLDSTEIPRIKSFVQMLKSHRDTRHIPLIAYIAKDKIDVCSKLDDVLFDDLFCPQQQSEYSYIASKITAIYRRLQMLRTMQVRSELLELGDEPVSKKNNLVLWLDNDHSGCIKEGLKAQGYAAHYCDSSGAFEAHIKKYPNDVLIIDASQGLEAMKLASRLSSNVGQNAPVMVLIPEDQPQLAIQCIEMRTHDFVLFPIIPDFLRLKIATTQRWSDEYKRYNTSVDQQLSLSVRDELTGLYNRRYLNRLLARMSEETNGQRQRFSLCMIDVDHFKRLNDSYGHQVGDQILCQLAYQIELRVRRHDNVGRWGGEEFIIVFADVTEKLGEILAERIRQHIAEYSFVDASLEEALNLTISIGVAHHRVGESFNELVDRADKAMYKAKFSGRNCVVADNS